VLREGGRSAFVGVKVRKRQVYREGDLGEAGETTLRKHCEGEGGEEIKT